MTRQDIADMITSMGKPLTNDQLFTIGIAHKSIANKQQKDWDWLAEVTDSGMKGSAYRSMVNNRLRRELKENGGRIFTDKEYKLGIAEVKNRDYLNGIRKFNREEARIDELKEFLANEIKTLPNLPHIKVGKSKQYNNKKTGILLLSDWHIGQDNDNFIGKFNYDIACKRVEKIGDDVEYYVKSNQVNDLEILLLGDFFEGFINTNARIVQEMDVCTQLIKSSELLCKLLNRLQGVCNKVTVRGVTDNHSRHQKDMSQVITKENLYKVQEWFIKERLKGSKIIFPNDNLSDYLGMFKLDCGKTVAFEHGHMFGKNLSLQALLPAKKGTWINIVCLGHYHTSCTHQFQGMKVFCNGALCNAGDYANEKHLFSDPEQKLLIVDEHNIMDIDIGFDSK